MSQVDHKPILALGVVEFLNTTPMIAGLELLEDVSLSPTVPSKLMGRLEQNEVDFALASSIDYQRSPCELKMLPSGVLSSDGSVLTVQVCSKIPIDQVMRVHCDSDSHTSIALMQLIMHERYGILPEVVPTEIRSLTDDKSTWPDTILMIGDKVVTNSTQEDFPYLLDLGEAWQVQTGLPFVFAAWFGKAHVDRDKIFRAKILLDRQLKCNLQRVEQLVSHHAMQRGWESEQAFQYLSDHMEYACTPKHLRSLELFYTCAFDLQLITSVKPLELFD